MAANPYLPSEPFGRQEAGNEDFRFWPSTTLHNVESLIHSYTGGRQTFEVPAGVTTIKVVAGAAGGSGSPGGYGSESAGGAGGSVKATIPVTPGEKLAVFVGGEGVTAGGSNGGGGGGGSSYVEKSATHVKNLQGAASGNGLIVISWSDTQQNEGARL